MIKIFSLTVLSVLSFLWSAPGWAGSLKVQVMDQQARPLASAVLTLKGPPGKTPAELKADMDQRDQEFVPRVLAVHSNTQVKFPNSDNIRHQVYSFSAAKRFELRLYSGTPSDPLLFDKPGVVVLGCNIHDWMVGYIYVTEEPWFAVTDDEGVLKFDDMPAGQYSATLWHPRARDMQPVSGGDIVVSAGDSSKAFTFEVEPGDDEEPAAPPSAFGDAFHKAVHP